MDFAEIIHEATRTFPPDEVFGLTAQLRKASVSVASNIAEGHGRGSAAEFARFTRIARGSLKESETQLLLAGRFGYLLPEKQASILATSDRLNRLLTGLLKRLRK